MLSHDTRYHFGVIIKHNLTPHCAIILAAKISYSVSLRAGRSRFRIPKEARDCSLLLNHPNRVGGPPSLLQNEYRDSFRGKQPGREVCDTLPSNAEVKNKQNHTSASSIGLYGVYRNNILISIILLINKYVTNFIIPRDHAMENKQHLHTASMEHKYKQHIILQYVVKSGKSVI
jgi:hypothetical protein